MIPILQEQPIESREMQKGYLIQKISSKESSRKRDAYLTLNTERKDRRHELYQEAFSKKERIDTLARRVQKDRGITFQPKINSSYRPPPHLKTLKQTIGSERSL